MSLPTQPHQASALPQPLRPSARPGKVLSRAESRVLAFSAAGYSKEETAHWLGIGSETVKSQRASIIRKLKARNMTHAVSLGYVRGHLGADTLERVERYVEQVRARRAARETRAAQPV